MPRFEFQLDPIEGESIVGYIIRSAIENCYDTMEIFRWLKSQKLETESPVAFSITYSSMKKLTGLSFAHIRKMHFDEMPYPIPFLFPQIGIDRALRHAPMSRFAPNQLKKTAYHRLHWDLNFLVADFESGEMLQSRCPACDKSLNCETRSIINCRHCRFDFRDAESTYGDVSTLEINGKLAKLCSSRHSDRKSVREALPSSIQNWSITELILAAHWFGLHFRTTTGQTCGKISDVMLADINSGFDCLKAWPEVPERIFNDLLNRTEEEAQNSAQLLSSAIGVCNSAPTPSTRAAFREVLAKRWDVNPQILCP